jgi:ketosteroid isomerase-like protein
MLHPSVRKPLPTWRAAGGARMLLRSVLKGNVLADGVEIVSSMSDEWNAHDLDAVYSRLADDYREYANGTLVKIGRDETRLADQALYEMIPDYGRTVEETWGHGDRVVSRFTIHGTMRGGGRIECAVAAIYGIRDGQISEAHVFFDPANALRPA